MSVEQYVLCELHDEPCIAHACHHLVENPWQRWYSDHPSEADPWPDAWCAECELEYRRAGEWNEQNIGEAGFIQICPHCYENGLSASVEAADIAEQPSWKLLLRHSFDELKTKQDRLIADYQISLQKDWDYDDTSGVLVLSNDGRPTVIAEVEFIGSLSRMTHIWRWAWADFGLDPAVRGRITAVRDFGEAQAFPRLTVPTWQASETEGWELAGIAVRVLDAFGAYRVQHGEELVYMAIMGIRRA